MTTEVELVVGQTGPGTSRVAQGGLDLPQVLGARDAQVGGAPGAPGRAAGGQTVAGVGPGSHGIASWGVLGASVPVRHDRNRMWAASSGWAARLW